MELEPWREAIRRAAGAVGLIEFPSLRFVELSPDAKELVGPEDGSDNGLERLGADERIDAEAIATAATIGSVDGCEAQRRQLRRPDGSIADVLLRGRAVRVGDAAFGLVSARELSHSALDPSAKCLDDAVAWSAGDRSDSRLVATLDDRWRVRELTGDAEVLRDVVREGVAVSAITHPDDMARLLFVFAGATTQVDASTRLRLLAGCDCAVVDVDVTRLSDGWWRLAFTVVRRRRLGDEGPVQSVTELAGELRRIVRELQDAIVASGSSASHDILRVSGVSDLPERQREIVLRLARGERVGTIASGMFLSAHTVRNHLSAVFRKFGVHSQEELLVVLRGDRSDASATVG
jgi:DNA-binding CsgD family transcriptional regulator